MKRIIIFLILCCLFLVGPANAATRITVTKDSAGTMSHVTCYVTESGQTVWQIDATSGISFYINSAYIGNLSGPAGSGVSQISAGTPGYFVIYDTSVSAKESQYASGASIDPTTNISTGVSSMGKFATIGVDVITTGATTETLSGNTVWGTYISNYGALVGGVTRIMPAAQKGMSTSFVISQNTYTSGGTVYIHWPAGQTLLCNQTITAGTSKFCLGGTVGEKTITCIGIATDVWQVQTTGTPTIDWD